MKHSETKSDISDGLLRNKQGLIFCVAFFCVSSTQHTNVHTKRLYPLIETVAIEDSKLNQQFRQSLETEREKESDRESLGPRLRKNGDKN